MIIDISNEVFTKLKTELDCLVVRGNKTEIPSFPCITFSEINEDYFLGTIDSSGENHTDTSYEINIFTTGETSVTDMKTIRNQVDSILSDFYGMNRITSMTVENYLDNKILRYVLRYNFIIDKNKQIYRR